MKKEAGFYAGPAGFYADSSAFVIHWLIFAAKIAI